MIRRNVALSIGAAITLLATAILYLSFDGDSAEDGAGNGRSALSASAPGSQIVRKDETVSAPKQASAPPAGFDASKYTTAPKPGSVANKILQIFMDRQMPDHEKVQRLLNMVPQLSDEEKYVAMDRATQLIPDEDYLRLRPQLLRLAQSDELRQLVMLDMLTRDDGIKMPSLVELLRNPSETTRTEAREILEAFLEKDYGDDPQRWDAPVQRWLAENQEL